MIGAAFIITDPIFQGLAISLVFGLASSTLLTVPVIPALDVWLREDHQGLDAARLVGGRYRPTIPTDPDMAALGP
jgi:Cu/Ag efflux pump CusA